MISSEEHVTSNTNSASANSLKGQYSELEQTREPYLNRGRACAALTIPSILVPQGHTEHSPLPTPYQSLGARGVNNMAAKLMMTLFPPNQPFFRLAMSEDMREKLGAAVGEVEQALNRYERIAMSDFEGTGVRPRIFMANKHFVVTGNALIYQEPKRHLRVFQLNNYVCRRYPDGRPMKVILKEAISPSQIPQELKDSVNGTASLSQIPQELKDSAKGTMTSNQKTVDLYTGILWYPDGTTKVHQEINGFLVPGSEGSYPKNKCPWIPARMIIVEGEDYGRSYVEEFIGDLMSLEALTKAMVKSAQAAAKTIFMVDPNGMTDDTDFANADGGDTISGRASDVSTPQTGRGPDMQFVETRIQKLTEALSYAFLLNSSIQREGERVTAVEIRYMANELDTQIGGLYSAMSQEIQLPLVALRIHALQKAGKLPRLPDGAVEPVITTGVDAIGRGNDFDKLSQYIQFLATTLGPEAIKAEIHGDELARRAGAGIGIETEGLVKTREEKQAEVQQAQQQALQQQAVGPAINAAGRMATQGQPPQQPTQ